ncbi:MAG: hypothetical protein V1744_05835 [Candidatus Altiarchaeota archaeon]
MALNFSLKFTTYFERQWLGYGEDTRGLITEKLIILKQNPFRYPTHTGFHRVHKIKLTLEGKYQRLMYAVFMPDNQTITVLGVFDRSKEYKDFERIFAELRK